MKIKSLFCCALTAVALVSCSDNDTEINNKSGEVTFVSGLSKHDTRINQEGNQWVAGDQVGIYMVESGKTTVLEYANVPYAAESSAQVTLFKPSGTNIYYPESEAPVDFIAYHPYASTVADMVYPINLASQSASLIAHDLLYAKADNNGAGFTSGSISLGFTHKLSKVVLNFVDESDKALTPDADGVTIKGMNTTANFDLKTGTLSNEGTVANIAPYKNTASYEAILLPFTVAAGHETIITVGGRQYAWSMNNTHSGLVIKEGFSYTFKVTIKESDSVVEAVLVDFDGSSITPWGDGATENKPEEPEVPTDDIEIPADFNQVKLATGESISTALSTATGKVAIVLANGGAYEEASGFEVPNTITSLMIVGEGGTTMPSVYFSNAMRAAGNMDKIHLYNVELHGTVTGYFINQDAETGVTFGEILIENSTIHNVRGVVRLQKSASTINSLKVTNSIIYNIGNYNVLTVDVDDSSTPSIEITKSTLYNMLSRSVHFNKTVTATPTVTIDQCTFHLGPYQAIVQFNKTSGGTLNFTNNIIGLPFDISEASLGTQPTDERGVSVRSNGAMGTESGNYYVKDTKWQSSATGEDCGFTAAELFADPAKGDFTQSKLTAGDPRWY